MLYGLIIGLLLIDEKDLGVLKYIAITPLSLNRYLLIKCGTGVLITIVYNFVFILLLRYKVDLNLILTIILCSGLVPYFSIFIFIFSKNKVEALTKGKLSSLIIIGAVVPYFIPSKINYILGVFPTFWIEKIFYSNLPQTVIYFIIALLFTILTVKLMMKKLVL